MEVTGWQVTAAMVQEGSGAVAGGWDGTNAALCSGSDLRGLTCCSLASFAMMLRPCLMDTRLALYKQHFL